MTRPPTLDDRPAVPADLGPNIVCITAEGLAALPNGRADLPNVTQLIEAGRGYPRLPTRAQLERLRLHGYDVILIDRATSEPESDEVSAQVVCDEAVRFIAGHRHLRPFALSLVLPCAQERVSLQRLDRGIGQVLTSINDWGLDGTTRVLLGPVRPPRDTTLS